MQQMLLLLLAIIVLALYAFGQQMDYIRAQEVAVSREMEVAMMDVHQIWGSHMANLAFAEEIADGTIDPGSLSSADLPSLARPLGPDPLPGTTLLESGPAQFDDFDDFNGYSTSNYLFPVRGVDMPFTVEVVGVWYTADDESVSSTPTAVKSALLRVSYVSPRQDLPAGEDRISLDQIVKLSING